MSYIGRGTESISNVEVLDNLTFDGSASYTLQKSSVNFVPSSANNLLISISGVVQQGNFSVSGSTITFDTTVSASDTCDWILHYGTGLITTVADGAITEAKLGSNAVTTAKINNGAVSYAKTDGNFGKIGQVVSFENSFGQNLNTTAQTDMEVSSGVTWEPTITPSSTSSKILVHYNISTNAFYNGGNEGRGTMKFYEKIGGGSYSSLREHFEAIGAYDYGGHGIFVGKMVNDTFLRSPNTTSPVYYKFSMACNNSGATCSFNFGSNQKSHVTLMEVLA